jgi:hypothetical protein
MIPNDERSVDDTEFLLSLDKNRRDLRWIRDAAKQGNIDIAKRLFVSHFRNRKNPKWFFDHRQGKRGSSSLSSWDESSGQHIDPLRHVDALLKNRFHLREDNPSLVWDFGPKLKWHTAEMRQLASTPYRLKRAAFFRHLAIAYSKTGRAKYATKFAEFVDRWLKDWPLVISDEFHPDTALMTPIDGHDTMTAAYRWMSWMDCLHSGIVFAPEVPTETSFQLIKSLWFIAIQYRHYAKSKYVPANHHLFERGTAPLLFGIMLPEFPEVAKLVNQAKPVIAKHVDRSFLPDGGYEERSTSHAIFALDIFLLPYRLAKLNRVSLLAPAHRNRIKRCGEMVALLTLPDGSQPDIGDHRPQEPNTTRLLGMVANLAGSSLASSVIHKLKLNRTFVDHADRPALVKKAARSLPLHVHYPDSGFFVSRSSWTRRASAMAFSLPGPGIPNHAHDDPLHLQLMVKGVPIIGSPISELYSYVNRNRQAQAQLIRGHFYAMTSHNLVLVDGEPLHPIRSLIPSWGPEPTPVEAAWKELQSGVNVSGNHRGYGGVQVSRDVTFRHRTGWEVVDQVHGSVTRPHIARWHFEYGVEANLEGAILFAKRDHASVRMEFEANGKCKPRLYRDKKWLGKNPLRPGVLAPWVLDVRFGGGGEDWIVTRIRFV